MVCTEVENKKENHGTKYTWDLLLKKMETAAMAAAFLVYMRRSKSD